MLHVKLSDSKLDSILLDVEDLGRPGLQLVWDLRHRLQGHVQCLNLLVRDPL